MQLILPKMKSLTIKDPFVLHDNHHTAYPDRGVDFLMESGQNIMGANRNDELSSRAISALSAMIRYSRSKYDDNLNFSWIT